jgi:hypothetical protein
MEYDRAVQIIGNLQTADKTEEANSTERTWDENYIWGKNIWHFYYSFLSIFPPPLFASSFLLPAYLSLAFKHTAFIPYYSWFFVRLTFSVSLFLFLSLRVPYVVHCIPFTLFPTSYSYSFIHSYPRLFLTTYDRLQRRVYTTSIVIN